MQQCPPTANAMRDLGDYFEDVVRILTEEGPKGEVIRGADVLERGNQYGRLNVVLHYADDSTLHILLWADCSGDHVVWRHYSFNYLDARNAVRFRYDNAPHHPELPTFPDHLHWGGRGGNTLRPAPTP